MIELAFGASVGSNGRVALVTGAARGIGLGIAAWLISESWQVVLADRDPVRGAKVAEVLGENACFIAMDVADEAQVARGVAEVLGRFGRLDCATRRLPTRTISPSKVSTWRTGIGSWRSISVGRCC